jgi:hypothetical protein
MKNILLVIVAFLVFIGGLGWFLFTSDNPKEPPTKTKVTEDNNTKPVKVNDNATKPVKELTKEDIVGAYKSSKPTSSGVYFISVFDRNGVFHSYINNEHSGRAKWTITNGEIVVDHGEDARDIYVIDSSGNLKRVRGEIGTSKWKANKDDIAIRIQIKGQSIPKKTK